MRGRWKPILALLLLAPFLTELLSGSLPPALFFRPPVFIFLTTVGYGFPLLLLREFAVRQRLGLAGLFLLGLVYGIYNEGILAKTFYLAVNVPVRNFDGYGYVGGIALPWALTISCWHALHSFIYPITAIYYFFPGRRQTPWLGRTGILGVSLPTLMTGVFVFFHHGLGREAGRPVHFFLMAVASGLLMFFAVKIPRQQNFNDQVMPNLFTMWWGGLGFLAVVLLPILIAGLKTPLAIFFGYHVLLAFLAWQNICRSSFSIVSVLLFALGDDLLLALFGIGGAAFQPNLTNLITNAFFVAVFVWFTIRLRRRAPSEQLQ